MYRAQMNRIRKFLYDARRPLPRWAFLTLSGETIFCQGLKGHAVAQKKLAENFASTEEDYKYKRLE